MTVDTNVVADNTAVEITFTPALPDYARYRLTMTGVLGAGGGAVMGPTEVIFTRLLGDANGDLRVRANDVGGVRSLVGVANPIDPTNPLHVRSDATCDGRVRANDVAGVRGEVGKDARLINDP